MTTKKAWIIFLALIVLGIFSYPYIKEQVKLSKERYIISDKPLNNSLDQFVDPEAVNLKYWKDKQNENNLGMVYAVKKSFQAVVSEFETAFLKQNWNFINKAIGSTTATLTMRNEKNEVVDILLVTLPGDLGINVNFNYRK